MKKPVRRRQQVKFDPFSPEAVEDFRVWLKSMTREELAERMTTYEPGVPHYWLGQPVEPITKEELLAAFDAAAERDDAAPAAKAA